MEGSPGHRERVKERFLKEGLDHFQPHEFLEFVLFYAIGRRDTKGTAKALLRAFGSVYRVFEATTEELQKIEGVGEHTATYLHALPLMFRYYSMDRWGEKPDLNGYTKAGQYCTTLFIGDRYEKVKLLALNSSYRLLQEETLLHGTINQVTVYPRLVVEFAIRHQASYIILAHNHPGGSANPSQPDITMTNIISDALSTIDVKLVDHIIVRGDEFLSIKDVQETLALKKKSHLRINMWQDDENNAAEPK